MDSTQLEEVDEEEGKVFAFIAAYEPRIERVEPLLKPFLPDFVPAVSDTYSFVKVPRFDGVEDTLGLVALDEPSNRQYDMKTPQVSVLPRKGEAETRAGPSMTSGERTSSVASTTTAGVNIGRISRADKNPQQIDAFLRTVADQRQKKPSASVRYTKPMPSIESLMQEWPPDFEQLVNVGVSLPSADLDVPTRSYVEIVCALLDIPIHKSYIQSLHVLFSLYLEFKNSDYFRTMNKIGGSSSSTSGEVQREAIDSGGHLDTLIL